ncbi:hypothetical protein PPERSA_03263 [Pseudocohnilembus persalinus]|uniref:Leucine-rich repeat n=1 Tax=Pseudocohnilembus persalinus TaxID=266149 RepID=A0A0V0QYU4_PSEPJ|nr:hypothetical protein PPERSA_03263 [Pseudocohnilembus persalinus]|eukprot:KRX07430.1 hypothetical protein PPERSA_03263 [Pseudocohnilembus persalinus]
MQQQIHSSLGKNSIRKSLAEKLTQREAQRSFLNESEDSQNQKSENDDQSENQNDQNANSEQFSSVQSKYDNLYVNSLQQSQYGGCINEFDENQEQPYYMNKMGWLIQIEGIFDEHFKKTKSQKIKKSLLISYLNSKQDSKTVTEGEFQENIEQMHALQNQVKQTQVKQNGIYKTISSSFKDENSLFNQINQNISGQKNVQIQNFNQKNIILNNNKVQCLTQRNNLKLSELKQVSEQTSVSPRLHTLPENSSYKKEHKKNYQQYNEIDQKNKNDLDQQNKILAFDLESEKIQENNNICGNDFFQNQEQQNQSQQIGKDKDQNQSQNADSLAYSGINNYFQFEEMPTFSSKTLNRILHQQSQEQLSPKRIQVNLKDKQVQQQCQTDKNKFLIESDEKPIATTYNGEDIQNQNSLNYTKQHYYINQQQQVLQNKKSDNQNKESQNYQNLFQKYTSNNYKNNSQNNLSGFNMTISPVQSGNNTINMEISQDNLSFDNKNLEFLRYLPNLEFLNVGFNKLQNLEGVQNCQNLSEIHAQNNMINKIQQVQFCTYLKLLNFDNNLVKELADLVEISGNLKNSLQLISLKNNPISKINKYRALVNNIFPYIKGIDTNLKVFSDYSKYQQISFNEDEQQQIYDQQIEQERHQKQFEENNSQIKQLQFYKEEYNLNNIQKLYVNKIQNDQQDEDQFEEEINENYETNSESKYSYQNAQQSSFKSQLYNQLEIRNNSVKQNQEKDSFHNKDSDNNKNQNENSNSNRSSNYSNNSSLCQAYININQKQIQNKG